MMDPKSGEINPVIILNIVVFPTPLGPSSLKFDHYLIVNLNCLKLFFFQILMKFFQALKLHFYL